MHESIPVDFHPMCIRGEARAGCGEDNWAYGFCEDTGIIAVFDGCGGSGARKHEEYHNNSEAFMASRLCSGALFACVQNAFPYRAEPARFAQQILTPCLSNAIKANTPSEKAGGIKVNGMRTLPSTMAAAFIQSGSDRTLNISPIWAGDSRAYVLDASGLSQLTIDDSNQPDPMEGLYDEGTLTNVICADKPIRLNCRTVQRKPPFMVITATDGCFGYVSSPMEFEGMLLHTLLEASSVAQWEDNLRKLIAAYAGDDYTLCLASFGYDSFGAIQGAFADRYRELKSTYLEMVWAAPWEDRDTRRRLWATYRRNYLKYLEGEMK